MNNVNIRTDMFICDSYKSRAVRDILDKAREEIVSVLGTGIYIDVRIQKGDPFCSADEMPDAGLTEAYSEDSEKLSKAGVGFPTLCENGKSLPILDLETKGIMIEFETKETPKEKKERISFDKELAKAVDAME